MYLISIADLLEDHLERKKVPETKWRERKTRHPSVPSGSILLDVSDKLPYL
jgi:hypothetical protein